MAQFNTLDEKIQQFKLVLDRYDEIIERFKKAVEYEKNLDNAGSFTPGSREINLNYMLDGVKEALTLDMGNMLNTFEDGLELWPPVVDRSMLIRPDYWLTGILVDVDNGASRSTLTRIQEDTADIFDVFDAADVVEITNAEDPNHNGLHTVLTATVSVLTFTSTMLGKDNASDETMIIRLFQR